MLFIRMALNNDKDGPILDFSWNSTFLFHPDSCLTTVLSMDKSAFTFSESLVKPHRSHDTQNPHSTIGRVCQKIRGCDPIYLCDDKQKLVRCYQATILGFFFLTSFTLLLTHCLHCPFLTNPHIAFWFFTKI